MLSVGLNMLNKESAVVLAVKKALPAVVNIVMGKKQGWDS